MLGPRRTDRLENPDQSSTRLQRNKLTGPDMDPAKQIIEFLGLTFHPTCGFVAETYRSRQHIPRQAFARRL